MKKTLKLFGVLLFLASCKSETEQRIVGKWQAVQLTECDNLVPIQTELVDIEFSSEGKYVFHSTLNVREEGNYRIKKNYLFTQDKLRDNAPEKAVLIKSLDADSMVLQMSYKGKDQYLTLAKEGASDKKQDNQQDSKAVALAAGGAAVAAAALPNNPLDSIQKAEAAKKAEEEKKKQAEANKEAERKKAEAEADKKREAEADRKREEAKKKSKEESSSSSSEAYKKREAKRKAEERQAKEEAEKRAEKFRKEYAKREAEKKKKK